MGLHIALGQALAKLRLLLGGEKRYLADLLEVHTHRIIDAHGIGHLFRVEELFLLHKLQILVAGGHVVGLRQHLHHVGHVNLHTGGLQSVIDQVGLLLVGVNGVQGVDKILGCNALFLFAALQKLLQFFMHYGIALQFVHVMYLHILFS